MKMVESYIRYEKLEAVREKLFALEVSGMLVSEFKGIGKPLSQMGSRPGAHRRKGNAGFKFHAFYKKSGAVPAQGLFL